jgi:hypothetical protein
MQPRLQRALQSGLMRSPKLRQLVSEVENSDVIVYVDLVTTLPPGLTAGLAFLNASEQVRYLYVAIGGQNSDKTIIQLLGHELQHVVEVAREPAVRSDQALRALYKRIGIPSRNGRGFDSIAARSAGTDVRRDLTRATARPEIAPDAPDTSSRRTVVAETPRGERVEDDAAISSTALDDAPAQTRD